MHYKFIIKNVPNMQNQIFLTDALDLYSNLSHA